jgi:hypothetical protein
VTNSITKQKKPHSGRTNKMTTKSQYTLPPPASASPRVQDTSIAALESLDPAVTARKEQQILEYIQRTGGATCWETATALRLPHQSTSPAITKLHRKGRIADTGERRPTGTGRMAIVWATVS